MSDSIGNYKKYIRNFKNIKVQPIYSILILTLILTACSVFSPRKIKKNPDSLQFQMHQQSIRRLKQYQTNGTIIYFSYQQKFYARFFWQKTESGNYHLLLFDPLGRTQLTLNIRPGQLEIIDNNSKYYTTDDPQKMIKKLTGISIPIYKFRQWILGLPDNASAYILDRYHRLHELNYKQNGKTWKVVYSSYDMSSIPAMPSFIDLSTNGQHIIIKMDKWMIE